MLELPGPLAAPGPPAVPLVPQLHVDLRPYRKTMHVVPLGELDLATVDELRDQLHEQIAAGFRRVVVDLRELEFIDSTGLALLLSSYRASQRDGWQLSIIQGPPQVRQLFDLAGLLDVLPFTTPHNDGRE